MRAALGDSGLYDDTIHIIDDDEESRITRHPVALLLVTAGYRVRVHNGCERFLVDAPDNHNMVVVADLQISELGTVDFFDALKIRDNKIAVIIISASDDVPVAVNAMKAGAFDFLQKPFLDGDLFQAIASAQGLLTQSDGHEGLKVRNRELMRHLTAREREVLEALMDGLSNKLIGNRLGISARTVEIHRSNLMSKLNVKRLAELVQNVISTHTPNA